MIKNLFFVLFFAKLLLAEQFINFGKFENDKTIFEEKDISKLSKKFLATQYISNTLKNSDINTSKENLVINFQALDCFTFIDTIEALKQSSSKQDFIKKLIATRYKNSEISYQARNHFFSDWKYYNNVQDITCKVGPCKKHIKLLNNNEKYLKEIATIKREIYYIVPKNIDISKIKSGDYIGIYSKRNDLDVTHTGILIKQNNKLYIRHASSLKKKIIDSDYFEYTKEKIGVIIYR